jgi:AcrR family transcriptional regulator
VAPKRSPTPPRAALIEAAARLIGSEGIAALTLRRLASEVGTSTMAIYTRFGGMDELRRAVREEGYARLAARLARVEPTDDPVEHLVRLCVAYHDHAAAEPDLYRVMFMEQPLDEEDAAACAGAFEALVAAVRRCIEAGRFAPADPEGLATELWATGHGIVTLRLAGLLTSDQAAGCTAGAITHLIAAFGADPSDVGAAVARATRHSEQTAR